ncbi:MFS transporter [Microcella indica]|uniref:MFS transporter n=1 Tax=Microcella indica TaxID=2750620 RepID=UPI0015CF75AB|nr:MFS transporter [Microcella indica]
MASKPGAAKGGALLIASLTLAMATGATGTYSYATLSPFLLPSLGMTPGGMGLLFGGLYTVAAASSGVIGRITDRVDPTLVVLVGSACSLVGTLLLAASFSIIGLAASALFAGLAMAASNPGSNGMIAHRIPPGSRAFATGIKQSGATGAGLYLAVVLPGLAVAVGWRWASLAAVIIPILAVITVLIGRRSSQAAMEPEVTTDPHEPRRLTWLSWLAGYALLLGVATGICNGFYVLYAHSLGFGVVEAGLVFAVFAVLSVIARIVWARLSETTWSPAQLLGAVAVIGAISALLCLVAPAVGDWAVWFAAGMGGLSIVGWNALGMVTIMQNVKRDAVGVSASRMLRGFFVGLAIGPLTFGALVEFGGYSVGWLFQFVVLLLAIGVAYFFGRSLAMHTPPGSHLPREAL